MVRMKKNTALAGSVIFVMASALSVNELAGGRSLAATGMGSRISALASSMRDPLAFLTERSPGRRGSGALHQAKQGGQSFSKRGRNPHERVLANMRGMPRPFFDSAMPGLANDIVPVSDAGPAAPDTGIDNGAYSPAPAALAMNSPIFFGPIGPGSSSVSSRPIPKPLKVLPGVVPEPGSWLMLIFGMGMAGMIQRKSNRRRLLDANPASRP